MVVRGQRAVIVPHVTMQLPRAALFQKDESLLAAVFELAIVVVDLRIRHLCHDTVVTVELVIAERYGGGF